MTWLVMALAIPAVAAESGVRVELEGVPAEIHDAVLASIGLQQQGEKGPLDEQTVRFLHRRAAGQIRTALQAFGYYRAEVTSALERQPERWVARYRVTPGEPIQYSDVTVELTGDGAQEDALSKRVIDFPIRVGDALVHESYEQAKQDLLRAALDTGYLDAQFTTREIRVDLQTYRAELSLRLDTGSLYHFGLINIVQDAFDRAFIERFVQISPGDRYSPRRLIELERTLRDTDYFSTVTVQPRVRLADEREVPVDVKLAMRPPSKYTFGVGYGTDTGARGSAGWERRWVNRRGHRIGANARISQIAEEVAANYTIPIRNPITDQLSFVAGYTNDHPDNLDSEIGRIGVIRSTLHGRTRVAYSLFFQHETYVVSDQADSVYFLMPGASLSRVVADDRIFPNKGLRLAVSARGAYQGVVSDISFLQLTVQGKAVRRLWRNGRILLRGDAGATLASEVEVVPASLRFYAGGDQSVRGYDYQELGPVDENGKVIGGRYLLVGSVEYEHQLSDQWSAAAFFDIGNAFDEFEEPLEEGAGVGIRWRSPVGPVRLDVANAISKQGRPWRLHITIGPDL